MINLCNDIITCIIKNLSYPELLKLTLSCKYLLPIQLSNYFLKVKDKFHNPNKNFETVSSETKTKTYVDIYINQIGIGYIWSYHYSNSYNAHLWPYFFGSLSYPQIGFSFKFSDIVWNKIKYRFKELDANYFELLNYSRQIYITSHKNDKDYLINQIKLLYYAFKYFKNEIVDQIKNEQSIPLLQ